MGRLAQPTEAVDPVVEGDHHMPTRHQTVYRAEEAEVGAGAVTEVPVVQEDHHRQRLLLAIRISLVPSAVRPEYVECEAVG